MKKILAVLLAAGLLSGCGQQDTAASAPASSSASSSEASSAAPESSVAEGSVSQASRNGEAKKQENGLMGRVTAIDGNVITLETMRGGGKRPDGELRETARENDGEKPAGPPDASEERKPAMDKDGGSGHDKDGGSDGGRPEGTPPAGTPGGGEQSTPPTDGPGNGDAETVTVTLPEDCGILLEQQGENTAGTMADIVVGGMIRVTYGEDGETVESVFVMEDREPQPAPDSSAPEAEQ